MEIRRVSDERRTRIELFLGEERASGVGLYHLVMRVDSIPVRMGGIGGVGTEEKHRMKGYASKVMEDSTSFMRDNGFDVAILFGIRDFYPKFGYVVCMPGLSASLSTKYAENAAAHFTFSPMTEDDYEDVRQLYEQTNRSRTGSVVREKGKWKGFKKSSRFGVPAKGYVAKDDAGGLEAYLALDEDREQTICCEVASRSRKGYEAAIRFIAEDAVKKRAGRIKVCCPFDHPFVDAATPFGIDVSVNRMRGGGCMGRITNQRALLEKLLPLFAKRLNASGLSGRKLAVTIVTELDTTTIAFDGKEAALEEAASAGVCEISAPALMQLVMGYRDAVHACRKVEGKFTEEALRALFPPQQAYLWPSDRF